ncbi:MULTISPECIES: polysaccharide deacetylase family protein [unclassified Ruminococcus]|uniref:polysaccharide deacetylase family protein n=1 Tax=unclassified Ruminococcus TaxID=2608920 RepID=UPI0021089102|nr:MULTISPECIES: polysaccharide deacetylase family protein [unclassified Ruminococcus]MCQ4021938.1 polysaccharide deacetylase family protein [Ruminococcus sp. zg-924]MCQ4114474.1 polysaccharide deacetylase family protein [Ruminococcus sp. zg-921]
MIKKLYPNGRPKAFNVSYDDGVLQDIRFVGLLNKYNLKGTFNLNSHLMKTEFEWKHESGLVIKRLSENIASDLYSGHEIASHTLTHPYMDSLTENEIIHELQTDKDNLEMLFESEVKGFAVPFDFYSELMEECVKKCGFEYARISEESLSYTPSTDFYKLEVGIFHLDTNLDSYIDNFLSTNEELAFCQIAGHSYDLDTENMWDKIEAIFKKLSADNNILPMTTIQFVEYIKAMNLAEITENYIKNNSNISLWFSVNDRICEIKPNEVYYV